MNDEITVIPAEPEAQGEGHQADEAPVGEAPVGDAPVGEAPLGEAPVSEAPVGEAPVEAAPVGEAPLEEAPVEAAPVGDAPVGDAPVEAAPVVDDPTSPPLAAAPSARRTPEGSDSDRLMAMLAWLSMVILQLPLVSIIQLAAESTRERTFQRHHAVTALLFYAAGLVYEILASLVFAIVTAVTLGCGALCLWVIFLVPHGLALVYALRAYNGQRVELPFLTDFAQRQGWL